MRENVVEKKAAPVAALAAARPAGRLRFASDDAGGPPKWVGVVKYYFNIFKIMKFYCGTLLYGLID
jgi:hypothetical protein